MLFDRIESCLNGQIDASNLADYAAGITNGVTTAKINDRAVTAIKVALSSLLPENMADTIGITYSGQYTGDGVTANRVIAIPFTPRYVLIVRGDATFITFESIAVGASVVFWYRDATGAQAANAANFQGCFTNGVKLGTNAAGTSNVAAVTYTVVAYK